jgi:hypothetical protein
MEAPDVTGALLIESITGLCLGGSSLPPSCLLFADGSEHISVVGKATEEDATFLTVASRSALDAEGVGAVAFKNRFVPPLP